jgi:tRNA pseudouridine38/39 synthase
MEDDLAALSREELIAHVLQLRQQLETNAPVPCPSTLSLLPAPSSSPKKFEKPAKRKREFNFSKYVEHLIALKIAYDGRNYHGLAAQETTENTIEGTLLCALEKTCLIRGRAACRFSKAGRTDKGVSASEQVVAFLARSNQLVDGSAFEEIDYVTRINNVLPAEIRVLAWSPVGPDFDARFSATYRVYRYFFVRGSLDLELMRRAASQFLGTHDFRNFCKADTEHVLSFERTLIAFDVAPVEPVFCNDAVGGAGANEHLQLCAFTIKGRAFLWHQVRCMVAVLFLIGQGYEPVETIAKLLDVETEPCKPQYSMASELPLVLHQIGYEPPIHWHAAAAPPSPYLVSSVLTSLCDRAVHHAYYATLIGKICSAQPAGAWWPRAGHHPGGSEVYSRVKLNASGVVSYTPLLQRARNHPLTWRKEPAAGGGVDDEACECD